MVVPTPSTPAALQDQRGRRRVLHGHPNGLVESQLRVIGAAFAVAGDEFAELGVDVVGRDHSGVDSPAQLGGTGRRRSEDGVPRLDHQEGIVDSLGVDLAGSRQCCIRRSSRGSPAPASAMDDRLVGVGRGAHDICTTHGVFDRVDRLGSDSGVDKLVGQRRDAARVTPRDLDDFDAVKAAQGAGMAAGLDPAPDHRDHCRAGAGQQPGSERRPGGRCASR